MYYQLTDKFDGTELGIVKVINGNESPNFKEEVEESWNEFHVLEEHELDNCDVDDFVQWHNEGRVTQIERVFLEVL